MVAKVIDELTLLSRLNIFLDTTGNPDITKKT